MASQYVKLPVDDGGAPGAVDSINGITGVVTLVGGTGISVTPSGQNIIITNTSPGGIQSINTDTTAAQTLTTGTTGTDFAIANPGSGSHVFNLPTASAVNRGALSSADWSTFNNKQPAGNYITDLTGDGTATGPGSAVFTLANTAVTPGSYTYTALTVDSKGRITAASSGAAPTGTVTSVALTAPASILSVSGSPITTSGTLALSLVNQSANTVFAGPTSGGAAAPTFRALVTADLPAGTGTVTNIATGTGLAGGPITTTGTISLANTAVTPGSYTLTSLTVDQQGRLTAASSGTVSLTTQVTGVLPIANGGTALSSTPTNGQLLIGNGTNYTLSTLTADTGVTITNASGSITVAANGSQKFVTKTANYTILSTDRIIYVDTSGGPFTLTLPDPTTVSTATTTQAFKIIDTTGNLSTNNLTLARFGSDKIEGLAASKIFQTDWGGWTIVTNNVDWFIY